MPSRNIVKQFSDDQYYHVYNRGVEKRKIFTDEQDYTVFIGLIKKYLTGEAPADSKNRHKFKHLGDDVSIMSYCLMANHFHLLLHQKSDAGISQFMRKLNTGYVMYFNNRHDRVGGLFQGVYKASHISSDPYLYHVSRYIHLNPVDYITYPYSSIKYYLNPSSTPEWFNTKRVTDLFDGSSKEYISFVEDYTMNEVEKADLKKIVAG